MPRSKSNRFSGFVVMEMMFFRVQAGLIMYMVVKGMILFIVPVLMVKIMYMVVKEMTPFQL